MTGAERGEEVVVTRRNKPFVKVVPIGTITPLQHERRLSVLAQVQAIGTEVATRGAPISDAEILEWIREARR